jgi:hypothetical protein
MSQQEIEAIKELKARYFRYFDTKHWDKWRDLFTNDCIYHGTSGGYADRDSFIAGCNKRLGPAFTVHHGHTPEIRILSPTTAKGIWPIHDGRWPPDRPWRRAGSSGGRRRPDWSSQS